MKRNCLNAAMYFINLNRRIELGNNFSIGARPSGKVDVCSCVETKEAILVYTS